MPVANPTETTFLPCYFHFKHFLSLSLIAQKLATLYVFQTASVGMPAFKMLFFFFRSCFALPWILVSSKSTHFT